MVEIVCSIIMCDKSTVLFQPVPTESEELYLLRGPESHRQFSGYEPDGLLLPYPAIYAIT